VVKNEDKSNKQLNGKAMYCKYYVLAL